MPVHNMIFFLSFPFITYHRICSKLLVIQLPEQKAVKAISM